MASEDVIELGSSDDEASPPPTRRTAVVKVKSVPKLNAMVNIPRNIHSVTIKPAKSAGSLTKQTVPNAQSHSSSKFATLGKISNQTTIKPLQPNRYTKSASKVLPSQKYYSGPKTAERSITVSTQFNTNSFNKTRPVSIPIKKSTGINPLSLMKNFDKSQIVINKITGPSKSNIATVKNPIKLLNPLGHVIRPNPVGRLPPSVTITKTQGVSKRPMITDVKSVSKKPKYTVVIPTKQLQKVNETVASTIALDPLIQTGEVLTVEVDDEAAESSSSKSNPLWYKTPEEQINEESRELEKLNNKEPETQNFIEICIEDSPVSKPKNRQTSEIDSAIIIEDSPVRHGTPKKPAADSDSENDNQRHKTPKKKRKKLDYSVEVPALHKSIEIEIEPMVQSEDVGPKDNDGNQVETRSPRITTKINKEDINNVDHGSVIEVVDSPAKNKVHPQTASNNSSLKRKIEEIHSDVELVSVSEDLEFHPVYQHFINLCFELDNSNDMKIIVEKKIKGYYKQVPKAYTESEEFIDMVSSKIIAMKANKDELYLFIKDIVDALNHQRKIAKTELLDKKTKTKESGKLTFTDDSEYDSKRQRQIRKLEKTIRKLHRAIQKLEEQEVDFDDEEDSVYLLTERYKERMVRVHAKLCQLTNTKLPSEPRVHIDSRPGQPTGPARRLEKWINKKVPVGKPLPFPDFHDVLHMVREANSQDKLGWNEADIMEEARDLFTRCGKKLQRRRQEIEWRIAASRLPPDADPAENNQDLKSKLERNRQLASKKEIDVFDKYAERQSEMKLVGEEIGDKDAEESPLESEDDEATEEASALADKEKRKERIKRLIQEKSNKKSLSSKEDLQTICEDSIAPEVLDEANRKDDTDTLQLTDKEKSETNNCEPEDIEIQLESTRNYTDKAEKKHREPENRKIQPQVTSDADGAEQQTNYKELEKSESQSEKNDINRASSEAEMKDTKSRLEGEIEINADSVVSDAEMKGSKSKLDGEIEINSESDVSEVDELHLLEKLYSESENNSTSDSSDSDSPIDISDTVDSDEGHNVISIENSSESDTGVSNCDGKKDTKLSEVSNCDGKKDTKLSEVIEVVGGSDYDMIKEDKYDEIIKKADSEHDPFKMDSSKINGDILITSDPIPTDKTVLQDTMASAKISVSSESVNADVEESLESVIDSIESIIKASSDKTEDDNLTICSQLTEKENISIDIEKQKSYLGFEKKNEVTDKTISEDDTVVQLAHDNCVKASETDCEKITEEPDAKAQTGEAIETTLSISTHELATADLVDEIMNTDISDTISGSDKNYPSVEEKSTA